MVNHNVPWGWEGDGVIAGSGCSDELADFFASLTVPVVDLSYHRPNLPFPRLLSDNETIGRQVAEHFISRGFKNFLFSSFSHGWFAEERWSSFSRRVEESGHLCRDIRTLSPLPRAGASWQVRRDWLAQSLRLCDWPLAVMGATDQDGADVIDTCRAEGILVPEQVAVVSVGNYDLVCEALSIPMSSVDNNQLGQGYEGARMLERLMDGEELLSFPYRIPSLGLHARRSSDVLAVDHPRIARAIHYMHQHFQTALDVDQLAKAAGMSRSGFYKAFCQHLGRTPGEELRRIRLEKAKKRLRETEEKISEVAFACGWGSANSLCIAFKRETGQSPMSYRRQVRG
jgi:LacI family transcriptional regulator